MVSGPVSEVMRQNLAGFTPAERKVARELLADYPRAGLETVARLAQRADVSPPSVVRLVTKLGYSGFPDFQEHLRQEVAARSKSALAQYIDIPPQSPGDSPADRGALARTENVITAGIRQTFEAVPPDRLAAAVTMICDPACRVFTIGGRFSGHAAGYLNAHLQLLRATSAAVPTEAMDRAALLLDIGRRDVVIAYDFRRYQHDTVAFGRAAQSQGAALIVFTDPWLSPLAVTADVVFPCTVTAPSPFDSLSPALALTEALIAAVTDCLGDASRRRIERFESLQRDLAPQTESADG
jgi:DNA-binding MurR/RpiR family transcriptional regulator